MDFVGARIVDENLDRAEFREGLVHHPLRPLVRGEIADRQDRFPARRLDLVPHPLGCGFIPSLHNHRHAFPSQRLGDAFANATRAARYDRPFPGQSEVHVVLRSSGEGAQWGAAPMSS